MKALLKTLIGGAIGISALYVVGKVCYEIGRDVSEVEHQLAMNKVPECDEPENESGAPEIKEREDEILAGELLDKSEKETEKNDRPTAIGNLVNKFKNAKMFIRLRKTFDKGERSPGILGSLLSNPDGAKIEAYVRNGGVQINVKPRAA